MGSKLDICFFFSLLQIAMWKLKFVAQELSIPPVHLKKITLCSLHPVCDLVVKKIFCELMDWWCIWYDFFPRFFKRNQRTKIRGGGCWCRWASAAPYASHVPTSRRPSGKLNCFHKADSFEITGSEVRNWRNFKDSQGRLGNLRED